MSTLELIDVTLGYDGAAAPLLQGLTLRLPAGWTGVVGPNGAGKTTLLRVATGRAAPRAGRVIAPGAARLCDQRTDDAPDGLAELLVDPAPRARRLVSRLGLEHDWPTRWSTLSHGERRRGQLASALCVAPDVLALDEPTNHVDAETRDLLLGALRGYRGIGLLVSHDRALLDALCAQCVFLDGYGDATLRRGTFTEGAAQGAAEHAANTRARETARREKKKLERVAADRRREAARADQRRSGRRIGRKDADARDRRNAAIVSGRDGIAGRELNQVQGRLRQAGERLDELHVRDTASLGITMRGAPARRDAIARLPAARLSLGPRRRLALPDLVVRPDDRIGIAGPNGAGKSTLLTHLLEGLDMAGERVVVLPQEIDPGKAAAIMRALADLPSDQRGNVLTAVACLGSDPQRILESERLSPGELRKVLLALGLARTPHLVVMDEPTNHMDLPSIECLEHALASIECALLLVSHDGPFLERLTTTRWMLRRADEETMQLEVGAG